MTQEQKELLLKDLCARLPYGVKGVNKAGIVTDSSDWYCGFVRLSKELENRICFSNWKPYLFPLSSMTGEQKKELIQHAGYEMRDEENGCHYERYYYDMVGHGDNMFPDADGIDWLTKNHFDYRGLIEKSLALDATNLGI